jgi:WD40 repeat protein
VNEEGDRIGVIFKDEERLLVFAVGNTQPIATYPGEVGVNAFQFLPKQRRILVGEHYGAMVSWSYETDERQALPSSNAGSIDAIAVSADGELAAAASGSIASGIQIWKVGEKEPTRTTIPGVRGIESLRFTRDGRFLISATLGGEVRYWRINGTGVFRVVDPRDFQPFPLPGRLYSIARLPGTDEFLIGGDHGKLQLWRSADLSGSPRVLDKERMAALESIPDQDRYLSNGRSFLLTGHVMAVAVARDRKRFAAVDPYGFVTTWDFSHGIDKARVIASADPTAPNLSLALSPSGRWMVAGANSTVTTLHELSDDGLSIRSQSLSMGGTETVRAVHFVNEKQVVVGDDAGRLTLWDVPPSGARRIIFESGPAVMAITSLDNKLVIGRGQQVDLVDLSEGKVLSTMGAGLGPVYSVAISDDHKLIAAGYLDGTIRIWSANQLGGSPITVSGNGDVVRSMVFDSTGERLLSVSDDGLVRSRILDRKALAKIVCDVAWRDVTDEERKLFVGTGDDTPSVCPGPT